jgi:hypothetical protein
VIPPNALRDGHRRLAEPVGPIHFAGEAFHERYSGFLHGAYLSGIRAARAIAEALASAPADRADGGALFKSLADDERQPRPHQQSSSASSPARSDGRSEASPIAQSSALSTPASNRGGRVASAVGNGAGRALNGGGRTDPFPSMHQ